MAARKAPPLRSVATDEQPAPRRKQTIQEAADSGNRRQLLVAMRERVAVTVQDPGCPPRDLSSLTRRLQEIAREIEAIDARAAEEGAGADVGDEDWAPEAL
jgi:hypothetical protein